MNNDELVQKKVAVVAASVRGKYPTWGVFFVVILFIILGMVGILILFNDAKEDRIATCERVNGLSAKIATIIIASENSIPPERYTDEVKEQLNVYLSELRPEKCSGKSSGPVLPTEFPYRPDRQPGQILGVN